MLILKKENWLCDCKDIRKGVSSVAITEDYIQMGTSSHIDFFPLLQKWRYIVTII